MSRGDILPSPESRVTNHSKVLVVGPGAAFRRCPRDDFIRILDVACLAMDAVRGVDLQTFAALSVIDHFIDARGTKSPAWVAVFLRASVDANARIVHDQVHRLRLIMHVAREVDGSKSISRR